MSDEIVIADRLSKVYKIYDKPSDRLKEVASFGKRSYHRDFKALDNVSFTLKRGERLGIVGENGSGKSTLLKILSSVLTPSSGAYYVGGRLTSLLELGTGFNMELTGEENVFQNGMLMGYSRADMQGRFPLIREFSELGDFIGQPLKTYSSGMLVRLAFACAVFVEPDILIIDEALSVGDAYFQNKCFYKIRSLLDQGVTFIYVTHNYDSIKTLCDRGIMLEHGTIAMEGESQVVSDYYLKTILEKQNRSRWYQSIKEQGLVSAEAAAGEGAAAAGTADGAVQHEEVTVEFQTSDRFMKQVEPLRTGTGEARICCVELLDERGFATERIRLGEEAAIRIHFEAYVPTKENFSIGVGICDAKGVQVLQFTTLDEGIALGGMKADERGVVEIRFRNPLAPGQYNIKLGIAELINSPIYPSYRIIEKTVDYCVGGFQFEVSYHGVPKAVWGQVAYPAEIRRLL